MFFIFVFLLPHSHHFVMTLCFPFGIPATLKTFAWLMHIILQLFWPFIWLVLIPFEDFFFSFNIFIFYFLWLVFLCSIQVKIAPTVTTWSNKTPTALPSHPPAASPSDTQVYPSLFRFEQDSAHQIEIHRERVVYFPTPFLKCPIPVCLCFNASVVREAVFSNFLIPSLFLAVQKMSWTGTRQQWFKCNFS